MNRSEFNQFQVFGLKPIGNEQVIRLLFITVEVKP